LRQVFERLLRRKVGVEDDILDMLIQWLSAPIAQQADDESEESSKSSESDESIAEDKKVSDDRWKSVLWGHSATSVLPHGKRLSSRLPRHHKLNNCPQTARDGALAATMRAEHAIRDN
jgi:hypothetical protein